MNTLDLQLNLLEGNPIETSNGLKIHKISFSEINKKIGYTKYNSIINLICLSAEDAEIYSDNQISDAFTFLIEYSIQSLIKKQNDTLSDNSYFIDDFLTLLQTLLNDTVIPDFKKSVFYVGTSGLTLNQNNFGDFQSIIKIRNCLENIEEEKDNPENDRVRALLEKRKKARDKLNKVKSAHNNEDEEPLTIADLISIYAEAEHMKLQDVFQYDVFQLNNQFNRMKIFKDYNINIQALLAGAKSDDINIQHWLSKIKTTK
jgi:hypothetical protein